MDRTLQIDNMRNRGELMEPEKLATSAVEASLAKTDRLSSFINSGDKEPCWDGNIYIHDGKNRTKKNIKKVATQVKGKFVKSGDVKDTIKYPISKNDLHAYMMNGGTVFFVVYLDKETGNTLQIYYASLLPFMIKQIMKEEKERYQINFQKFPQDNYQKTEVFLNFYAHASRQASFAGKDLPTIEELTKTGRLESLSIHYTGYGKNIDNSSLPKLIDGKSMTVYANIKGGVAPIPVEYYESIHQVTTSNGNTAPVSVNGVKYYDGFNVITTASFVELHIGSCVSVIIPNVDEEEVPDSISIKIKFKGTLRKQILGMEFVLAMIEHGSFHIAEHEYFPNFSEDELMRMKSKNISDVLMGYRHIQEVLDFMNVKKDLDIEKCSGEDQKKLNQLVGAIRENMPINECPENSAQVQKLTIANLNLAVVYLENEYGSFNILDYFGHRLSVTCETNENETVRISQFFNMLADDFLTFDNLNLRNIIDDYKRIEPHELLFEQGNTMMLEMLKAYDKKPSQELLEIIKEMSNWLCSQQSAISNEVTIINELQITLRERQLTFDEKSKLHSIIGKAEDEFFTIGAFLLLDEQNEAKKLMDNLTKEQLETFKNFPIYKFYKLDDEKAEK